MARTKTNTEQHKTLRTPRRNIYSEKSTFCVFRIFLLCFIYNFLKWFLQAMLSYRLGTVNDFIGGLN